MALVTRGWAQRAGAAADMGRHSSTPMRPVCRKSSVICSATNAGAEEAPSRRQLLASGVTAAACIALAPARPAAADEAAGTEYTTLLGLATPPTSYGGYGGNDPNATPKYSFEYPSSWKPEVPNKVEKGTQGVDSRVVNQRQKEQRAFVITLTRAGEDDKSFQLTNIESTFASFAGADYKLQDAISNATNVATMPVEVDGIKMYEYDIDSPEFRYLSRIAVKNGKVFALFVRSPSKNFKASESTLRHIAESFKIL